MAGVLTLLANTFIRSWLWTTAKGISEKKHPPPLLQSEALGTWRAAEGSLEITRSSWPERQCSLGDSSFERGLDGFAIEAPNLE